MPVKAGASNGPRGPIATMSVVRTNGIWASSLPPTWGEESEASVLEARDLGEAIAKSLRTVWGDVRLTLIKGGGPTTQKT